MSVLRSRIDQLDQEILRLVSERAQVALEVGHYKAQRNEPVYRPEREAAVIASLQAANAGPVPASGIAAIWTSIMSVCRSMEGRMVVAYLGPEGTFSEQALRQRFGMAVEALACGSLDEVFRVTEAGGAQFGIVPIENSTEGSVTRCLDLLLRSPLAVSGEVTLPVRHQLMTRSGTMHGVQQICAHPQALAQCAEWLGRHHPGIERTPVSSNAEGARMAAEAASVAAIAGTQAEVRWGLKAVARGIQDDPDNRTRFVVIGRHRCAPSGRDQTSLILSVPNQAGAVHALIEPLARHGVSMKRFESRPARQRGWEYHFYIDLIGHEDEAPVAQALQEVRERAAYYKSLGSYPTQAMQQD